MGSVRDGCRRGVRSHSSRSAGGTHAGARLARNAATPSRPSFDARTAAMRRRCRRSPRRRSAGPRPRGSAPWPRRCAAGPATSSAPSTSLTRASSSSAGAMSCTQADPVRLGRGEALGGEEVAPGRAGADRLDHVRRDRRRDQPELRLATARTSRRARAIAMSQHATRPTPPPKASPWTRAIVGLPRSASVAQHRRQRAGVGEVLGAAVARHPPHPVEVGAGAEAAPVAEQHDRADAVVGVERAQHARSARRSACRRRRCGLPAAPARSARCRRGCPAPAWSAPAASRSPAPAAADFAGAAARRAAACAGCWRFALAAAVALAAPSPWRRRSALRIGRFASGRHGSHIRNTPKVVGSGARFSAAEMREAEHAARVGGVDDAVVPQPRGGEVRVALALVLRADRRLERLLVLGAPGAALGLDRVAPDRREHARRLLAAHHRDARVRPHPQEARIDTRGRTCRSCRRRSCRR